jgi:hypothetical protein
VGSKSTTIYFPYQINILLSRKFIDPQGIADL